MAHSTLPVLTHPSFPQVLDQALTQEIRRLVEKPVLSTCSRTFETFHGSGNFISCPNKATIHDLGTDQEFCFPCWQEVGRG
jgi:hypothetical protein